MAGQPKKQSADEYNELDIRHPMYKEPAPGTTPPPPIPPCSVCGTYAYADDTECTTNEHRAGSAPR